MSKKDKSKKPVEDKHEKFVRVVTPRVNKALKAIKLIGNQSGSVYAYDEEDVSAITTVLRGAVEAIERRFMGGSGDEIEFRL